MTKSVRGYIEGVAAVFQPQNTARTYWTADVLLPAKNRYIAELWLTDYAGNQTYYAAVIAPINANLKGRSYVYGAYGNISKSVVTIGFSIGGTIWEIEH